MAYEFDLPDVNGGGSLPCKIEFGKDGITIQPKGHEVYDGDFAPILIEYYEGKVRLVYWPEINDADAVIVDMSGAKADKRVDLMEEHELEMKQ